MAKGRRQGRGHKAREVLGKGQRAGEVQQGEEALVEGRRQWSEEAVKVVTRGSGEAVRRGKF